MSLLDMERYERIRAACCAEHGLGKRNEDGRWIPRDDTAVLDKHALLVTVLVEKAKAAA